MRKFFSLIAAVLFAGSMMADPIVINASDVTTIASGATSGLDVTLQGINIVWQGAYYNSDGGDGGSASVDFRVYANKSMTLTAESNISKVEIAGYCKAGLTVTANAGTITTGASYASETTKGTLEDPLIVVDEIGATSVTLTCTKQIRAYIIRVTLAEGGETPPAPAVATPVISGDETFTESVIVTITCSTPEADIYYTTDGTTDPKCDCAAAPEYTQQIVLTETTTIMAAAYTGNDWSAVATKTFTKKEPLQPITCAAVYELAKGAELALNNVVVTYANGKNVYVQDATGSMLLYLNGNTTWEAGNILSGVQGTLDIYNGLYEVKMTDAQVTAVQPGQGEAPAPVEFIAAPVAADMNKYIVLKNVTVSAETFPSNKNMNATIGEETFVLRNQFNADIAFDSLKTYDITGVVAVYNATVQVYFINAEEVKDAPVEEWTEIIFPEAVAAADLPADAVFEFDGLKVAITDSENKMSIDGNEAYFGTADENVQYAFRLKTGGKSQDGTKKNFMNITVPADGDLRLAVRSGNKDDETRNLVLVQEGDTIYNAIVKDADAIEVAIDDSTTIKVFPYITVPVKAGEIAVGYPVNGLNFYAFGFNGTVAPVAEPDTIPTTAPAAPKQAEKDVMALYSSYYKQNNYNFNVLGWGGIATWQTLKLGADSVNVLACQDMKWEIMTNWDTNHYDMSAYETLHADLWAPADAKVKITFEALGTADGGSGYKNGVSVDIQKGWNSVDVPLNTWPENYNFADIRYLIFEGYQTPAGESFENNPFAFANVYFWKTPELIDPTNCAEAAEAALSVSENNELYKDSAVYTIPGYVTEIAFAYDSTKNNMSFWMADEKNGGKVLEAYKCVIMKADDAVRVGDLVKVTGCLTKYNKTPEFAAGCTVEIVERDTTPAVEPKNLGEKTIAEFLELKNKIDTCILTGIIDSVVNTQYGNFNIVDATGKVYVYGLLNAAGETKKCYEEENLAEGDTLTIKAIYAEYNNNPQVKNAIFVAVKHQSVTPIEPLTIPETAPAAPTADVNDVLAIYCNYYKENNLNFGISGWAGGYQTLSIDSTNIGYWTKMTWECIIDPLATDSAHNLSGYKKLHVDLWAPLPAKIKFTVEAVAGGNYKDGVVANLEQGWNCCDFVVAEWPGEYDFTNVKCFVFEQYQTPKGESFEQNPFAFANIYFYDREAQGIDNTVDGVKAQKFIQNGMLLIEKNGRVYTITGQAVR